MKSIAPTVEVEVIAKGVTIAGREREIGWHGPVSRAGAKFLLEKEKVKMYSTPVKAADEAVDSAAVEGDDAQDAAEQDKGARTVKQIPRTEK